MVKKLGIQQKMVGLFLLFFVPVVALCIWQQLQYYDLLRRNTSEYVTQLIDKVSSDIGRGIQELDRSVMDILYDKDTSLLLQNPKDEDAMENVSAKLEASRSNFRIKTSADCNIVLLSNDRKVVASTYGEWTGSNRQLGVEWIDKISRAQGGRVIISAYSIRRESGSTVKVVGIARSVRQGDRRMGILLLEIPMDYFYSFCSGIEFGAGGCLMLVDGDNYILYSTDTKRTGNIFSMADEDLSQESIVERQGEFIYTVPLDLPDSGLRTVAILSREQIENDINAMSFQMLLVIGLLGVCILLVFIFFSRSFCRPILSTCQAMKQLESGDFTVRVPQTSQDELGNLQRGFNHMAKKLGEFVEQEYIFIVREREAQLKELARMMDPHFMYNTLEAISMTAYLHDDRQTVQMLDRLADMYRFSSGSGQKSTLRAELKNAEDYLYLINIRCDGKIKFHSNVDESLLDCEYLKFSLQPLVENCVVHGFDDVQISGDIWLSISRENDCCVAVTIQDNGAGISDSHLERLRQILADEKIEMEHYPNMAVKNIHDRLRLIYGETAGVSIDHAPQGGTQVRLICPLIIEEAL